MTAILLLGVLTLTACAEPQASSGLASSDTEPPTHTEPEPTVNEPEAPAENTNESIDDDNLQLLDGSIFEPLRDAPVTLHQLTPVAQGEELVVLHTTMGDVTLRLFPEEAPMAVENFTTHARSGFYDGVIFHRVIPGFMIQGGCPLGTGTGGQSIWGEPFGLEPSLNTRHFRGALAMAHAGGAMGSQFYIVQNQELNAQLANEMNEIINSQDMPIGRFENGRRVYIGDFIPEAEARHYLNYGGTPFLDWLRNPQGHTVFGHVVEGMDVVDAIAATETAAGDRPVEDVVIERVSFIYYGE